MFYIKSFKLFYRILTIITILVCIFFIPNLSKYNSNVKIIDYEENGRILWPAPNYYKINSYFGKRTAPTSGASTFHKGIDIGAPEGSSFIAVSNGTITFADFLGGGGFTITLTDENTENGKIQYSYCHCNPLFLVSVGDKVVKGQVIGEVGPKYVYNVPGNRYTDPNGNPTNGATTGPHLHFGVRVDGAYVNPLVFFDIEQIGKPINL